MKALPRGEHFDERETWSVERCEAFQWRRLRDAALRASRSLPFYARRFADAGVDVETVDSIDAFARVPLLTKSEVLIAMRERSSFRVGMELEEDGATVLGSTSGTEGTAFLTFPTSWRRRTGGSLARAYWWAGLRPGTRIMTAAPAWHSMAIQESWVVESLGARCVVPWGTLTPQFAGRFIDTLTNRKPAFVSIFLPMLYAILAECRQRSVKPAEVFRTVDTLLVVGAPVTPRARERLVSELGIRRIFEGAGCAEGLLAMECDAHEAHHIFIDTCYVEIVDQATKRLVPPGTRGSLVMSSLVPHGSVYLRYETGDVAEIVPDACSCGRTWPRLEIYDRRANAFRVRDRELLWYDVRRCVDEVPALVGVPFAVIRAARPAVSMRLAIEAPAGHDRSALSHRLDAIVSARLDVPLRLEWAAALPQRWKGVTVIDETSWDRGRGN